MEVFIELLRPIPAGKLAPGAVVDGMEPPYGTCWQGGCKPDAWHVPVKVRSRYASMERIKAYVLSKRPDMDTSSWSYSRTGCGEVCVRWGDGEVLRIKPDEMAAIETEHLDDYLATDTYGEWRIECLREEWPASFGRGAVPLDAPALDAIREAGAERLAAMDEDALKEELDCMDTQALRGGRLLEAVSAAAALAELTGTAAFICAD